MPGFLKGTASFFRICKDHGEPAASAVTLIDTKIDTNGVGGRRLMQKEPHVSIMLTRCADKFMMQKRAFPLPALRRHRKQRHAAQEIVSPLHSVRA